MTPEELKLEFQKLEANNSLEGGMVHALRMIALQLAQLNNQKVMEFEHKLNRLNY